MLLGPFIKTAIIVRDLYLFYISARSRPYVIYVLNVKCIIHESAERLFEHIFHTIPVNRAVCDILPSNVTAIRYLDVTQSSN